MSDRLIERKMPLAAVTMAADGNLWASSTPIGDCVGCLVTVVKSGVVNVASLAMKTGPTAATILAVDSAVTPIDCSASTEKYLPRLGSYLQGTISSWSGSGSLAITIKPIGYEATGSVFHESKDILAAVSKAANGNIYPAAMPINGYPACLVNVIKTGSISAGLLTLSTGTNPLSLATVDDANAIIDCHSASIQKYVGRLDTNLQLTISEWNGTGSISVTIELLGIRS